MKTSRQIYCQYLLSTQINYTCTNLADHTDGLDHNSVYRYLKGERLRPALIWEKVKDLIVQTEDGYLLFDDTVLDKSYSFEIDGVRPQYSGNTHGVGTGIGIVNLVYYNAERDQYWIIDYRLFDPERDGIAVFPGVLKAAFIFGGRGGDGVISRRTATGWSAPAFFKLGGGSFGAQIGASKTDYVLLFMNEGALKGLLEDKFEIGGEVGIAAGPVGRAASASTNVTLDAAILSYSRSKGAFVGAALKGVIINPDNNLNEAIYGGMKARDVLLGTQTAMQMPRGVEAFPQALTRYSSRRTASR